MYTDSARRKTPTRAHSPTLLDHIALDIVITMADGHKCAKDANVKWILGGVGLALLAAGAARAVVVGSQSGIVIVVIAGGLLIISPFVIDRLESISAGTASVEVRFTQQVIDLGAPKTAKILRRTALADLAESYSFVHLELPDDRYHDARIYLQDLLVERAAAIAQTEKLDAREVRTLLKDGSAVIRVLALGLMSGDPSLADGASIAAAIGTSRSKNEQYHALRLAERCWTRLPKLDRQTIRVVLEGEVSNNAIPPESDRRQLADAVLKLPVG
jgi:hypothetical protein